MIKQLLQLVMPKQLSIIGFGTAMALGGTAMSIAGSIGKDKKIAEAQEKQNILEKGIQKEQGVRERLRQQRTARINASQAEAAQVAGGGSSGANTAQATIQSDLAFNLNQGAFNTATGNAISAAKQNTMNAGQPSTLDNINSAVSPLIMGNVAALNTFGSDLVK